MCLYIYFRTYISPDEVVCLNELSAPRNNGVNYFENWASTFEYDMDIFFRQVQFHKPNYLTSPLKPFLKVGTWTLAQSVEKLPGYSRKYRSSPRSFTKQINSLLTTDTNAKFDAASQKNLYILFEIKYYKL